MGLMVIARDTWKRLDAGTPGGGVSLPISLVCLSAWRDKSNRSLILRSQKVQSPASPAAPPSMERGACCPCHAAHGLAGFERPFGNKLW